MIELSYKVWREGDEIDESFVKIGSKTSSSKGKDYWYKTIGRSYL